MKYFASIRTLLEKSCSPNYVNREQIFQEAIDLAQVCEIGSLLHLACLYGSIGIVEFFLDSSYCTVAAVNKPDVNGDTPLHIAAKSNLPAEGRIVQHLLACCYVDPNIKNARGVTPLQLAFEADYTTIVQLLLEQCTSPHYPYREQVIRDAGKLTTGNLLLDVCSWGNTTIAENLLNSDWYKSGSARVCYANGDTLLDVSIRNDHPAMVKLLIDSKTCNLEVRDGNTLLHNAVRTGSIGVMKALLCGKAIDPNNCNDLGETALHVACREGNLECIKLLINDKQCDVDRKSKTGDTALHIAIQDDPSDQINITKYLIENARCNLTIANAQGNTPLHLACNKGAWSVGSNMVTIVRLLLSTGKVDLESVNNGGNTPLELASGNSQIIMELNSFADTKLKRPLQSYIKLFFMGNACAGKSTLIQAICIEASKLRRFIPSSQYKQVSGVEPLTAGIVPLAFRSKYFGNAILYDFAGQHEYYSSHAAVLENLVLSSPPIFLLVFNLSMPFEDVIQELAYWWSFIDSHCKRASVTPHVILIASHKDIVKSMGQNVKDKMAHILKSLREIPAKFHIAGHVFIDCRKLVSKRLSELLTLLDKTCKKVRKSVYVDLRCHTLHAFLTDQFQYRVACKVFEVEAAIWTEDTVLPQDRTYLEKLLSILNDQDRILFLKSEKKIEESWILLQRQTLLCEVNGSIFAPENFKQHIKDFARSTGVVPLSRIKKRFRRYHPEVIVGALTHLEFCFKIEDYQTLHILASDSEPQGIDYENEQFYFFPALVRANNPTGVWKENSQMTFQCGWCYECTHPYQFLTSRFLHVLILRLAFSFALAVDQTSSEDCPVIRKKCSIWKHGIAWWNGYGIETIVEVGLQRHWVVVMMRCARGQEVKCVELRSAVIKSILDTKHHFSTSIVMSEYLISPSSVQYPFEKKDETALYSLKEVATTVVKGQSHVTHEIHDHHDPTQLTELLPFEPYFAMNELVMQKLFCDEYSQVQVTNDDLTLIAEGACQKTELFKSAIKPTASEWRECRQKAGNDEILLCLLLLQILHKRGSRTFQDFQEQLSKFSIFCGRNPLDVGGVVPSSVPDEVINVNPADPRTPQPTVNWQYRTMSNNSADITRALAANKLSERLAGQLRAQGMIGETVYAHATNHGPDVIEYTRVNHLTTAILTSTKSNPQCYYDFITVLQMDGIREDAETALSLLPTDPPATSPEAASAQQHQQSVQQTGMYTNHHTASVGKSAGKSYLEFTDIQPSLTAARSQQPTEEVDDKSLGISDLHTVSSSLVEVIPKWLDLGLSLGLSHYSLEVIKIEHSKDISRCMTETLAAWLQRQGSGIPCWRTLVIALKSLAIGREDIALRIAREQGSSPTDSTMETYQDVDNTQLDIEDLADVREEVLTLHNWFHLGLALGLSYHTLKEFEGDYPQINDCKTEVPKAWLRKQDMVSERGQPSWRTLAQALSSPLVGKPEVANMFSATHKHASKHITHGN